MSEHTMHRCMRCGEEFACQTPDLCRANYDVMPTIATESPIQRGSTMTDRYVVKRSEDTKPQPFPWRVFDNETRVAPCVCHVRSDAEQIATALNGGVWERRFRQLASLLDGHHWANVSSDVWRKLDAAGGNDCIDAATLADVLDELRLASAPSPEQPPVSE